MMEQQVQYAVMCAMKVQRERLKSIEPKAEAVSDFEKFMQVRPRPNNIHEAVLIYLCDRTTLRRLARASLPCLSEIDNELV